MPSERGALAVGVVSGRLFAIGGGGGLTDVEAYDPAGDRWTTRASLLTGRYALAAETVAGVIYAVGGYGPGGAAVPTVEAIQP